MSSNRRVVRAALALASALLAFAATGCPLGFELPTVTPNSGPPEGGSKVTITGSNFRADMGVTFGGNAATGVHVTNARLIEAVTPPGGPGMVDINLVSSDGTTTIPAAFRYLEADSTRPAVATLTPAKGDVEALAALLADHDRFEHVHVGAADSAFLLDLNRARRDWELSGRSKHQILGPFLKLHLRQRSWTLSTVLAPPFANGIM
jgi:hypothetical protein